MIEKFNRQVASGGFMENVESKVKATRITMELERKNSRKAIRKARHSDMMSLSPAKQKSVIEEESSSSNSVSSCSSSSDLVKDLDDLGNLDSQNLKNKAKESSADVNPYVRNMTKKHHSRKSSNEELMKQLETVQFTRKEFQHQRP